MAKNKARKGIFISYSRKDEEYLKRVKVHLSTLGKDIEESVWDDSKLKPGEEWEKTIKLKINSAEIAIFLVSADFLASEFIRYKELPSLLEAAKRDDVTLISIILKPCRFEKSLLSPYQAINRSSKPLQNEKDAYHEEIYDKLASCISESLTEPIDDTVTLPKPQNLEEQEEMPPSGYTLTEQQSLLNIIHKRGEQTELIGDSLNKAKKRIYIMGGNALPIIDKQYDPNGPESSTCLQQALERGVQIRILIAGCEFQQDEERYLLALKGLKVLKEDSSNTKAFDFNFAEMNHAANHYIVIVDNEILLGAIFPNCQCKLEPALHFGEDSLFSKGYYKYFVSEWHEFTKEIRTLKIDDSEIPNHLKDGV